VVWILIGFVESANIERNAICPIKGESQIGSPAATGNAFRHAHFAHVHRHIFQNRILVQERQGCLRAR